MSGSWDCPLPIRVKDPWVSNRVMNGGHLLCGGLGKALHPNVCCQELSFVSPTGLQNGQQWSEQGYSQAMDKDDRKKKQEQCVHEGWQLIWRHKEKTGWLYDLVHGVLFFLQRENRKCKATTILHVGERTQANTSSILLSGKQKTGFLTTAIMHLLLVRMLHHTYTKCSFFYRKHHGQWIVKYTIPLGTPIRLLWPSLLGKL